MKDGKLRGLKKIKKEHKKNIVMVPVILSPRGVLAAICFGWGLVLSS